MRPYKWESDQAFITCTDMKNLQVYEVIAASPGVVKVDDWNLIATVATDDEDGDWYNGLQITDDITISGDQLKKLAEHLRFSRALVNREGLCYVDAMVVTDSSFPVDFFRLNDLFNWSKYEYKPLLKTIWNRCCMEDGSSIDIADHPINLEGSHGHNQLSSLTACRKKLQAAENEIKKLRNENAELRRKLEQCGNSSHEDDDDSGPSIGGLSLEDLNDIVMTRRTQLPRSTFRISTSRLAIPSQIRVRPGGTLRQITPLDERPGDHFPGNGNVVVYTENSSFDTDKWSVILAVENNKRVTLAFYEGLQTEINYDRNKSVYLPIQRGVQFSSNVAFFLADVRGYGVYCAFTY